MINHEGSAGSALVYVSLKRGLRAKPRLVAAEEARRNDEIKDEHQAQLSFRCPPLRFSVTDRVPMSCSLKDENASSGEGEVGETTDSADPMRTEIAPPTENQARSRIINQ